MWKPQAVPRVLPSSVSSLCFPAFQALLTFGPSSLNKMRGRRDGHPHPRPFLAPWELGVLPARVRGSQWVLIAWLEEVTGTLITKLWKLHILGRPDNPHAPTSPIGSELPPGALSAPPTPTPSHMPLTAPWFEPSAILLDQSPSGLVLEAAL